MVLRVSFFPHVIVFPYRPGPYHVAKLLFHFTLAASLLLTRMPVDRPKRNDNVSPAVAAIFFNTSPSLPSS